MNHQQATPRSAPARQLAALQQQRVELQAQQRGASIDLKRASDEVEASARAHRTAAARELAQLDGDHNTAGAKRRKASAEKAHTTAQAKSQAIADAIAEVDHEMKTVRHQNLDALLGEACADYARGAAQAEQGAEQIHRGRAAMCGAFAWAHTLTGGGVDLERNRLLREPPSAAQIAESRNVPPLLDDSHKPVIASSPTEKSPDEEHAIHIEEFA